jgi:type I restriction enzyme, S subunit
MIADIKPYPAMRDSGVPWLGEVPVGWEIRRNGRLFVQRNETGFPDLPILEVSLRTGVRVRDFDASARKQVMADRAKYKRAADGDIAYNMMRMWQGAVGVVPMDGLISPAYVVARPFPGTVPGYFAYLYRTDSYMGEVDNYSRGIVKDRNRLYWEQFKQIPTPCPPPAEQAAIVRFLDHTDRRIRRYIRAKQKLIKLLEEQKQAIIHRAVTRGLDPNVRLKPSGVEWLGDVPEHWEVVPFKRRVGFQEGPGIMAADFRDEGVPLLRISCLRGSIASLQGCNFLDPQMMRRRWDQFAVQSGDYLLSASASTGSVVLATEVVAGAIPYTGILRLWPLSDRAFMPFVRLYMGCGPFQDQIIAAKSGVAIEHFGPTHLKRMFMALPLPNEQREIVQYVDSQVAPSAKATERATREIEFLREYRTRLIVDVVTGKLDVREAAAQLPDEPEELQPADEADAALVAGEPQADGLDAIPEEAEA